MHPTFIQNYDPLGNAWLSTLVVAMPVSILLYFLAVRQSPAYRAALYGLSAAVAVALAVFHMPAAMVAGAIANGMVFAAVRMAWTLLAAVFVYDLTVASGRFEIIKQSVGSLTDDRRLQALLIAFAFSALLEGSGGGGAPGAICASMMVGLGFPPFEAVLLCLIGNSIPVANGGMGNPVRVLMAVTGLAEADLNAMIGRILPFVAMILPWWIVRFQTSWRDTVRVWPGLLACGISFGAIQFFWSNYIDNSLVSVAGGMGTLIVMALVLRWWKPETIWRYAGDLPVDIAGRKRYSARVLLQAWSPFVIVSAFVVLWGVPRVAQVVNAVTIKFPVPALHMAVVRQPPVVAKAYAEPAIFDFAWLQAVGSATFLAGLVAGRIQGLSLGKTLRVFGHSVYRLRLSLLAVLLMVGLGFLTRYSGMDATLGLAFAHTGVLFPIFGTMIGWLGVGLTGTAAGSNALFGSLQLMTANRIGISPVLMAAANSAGGVMGKMVTAQSLVVCCAATNQQGREGEVFRAVIKHSFLLTLIIAAIVMIYAYVVPGAVPSGHRYWW